MKITEGKHYLVEDVDGEIYLRLSSSQWYFQGSDVEEGDWSLIYTPCTMEDKFQKWLNKN